MLEAPPVPISDAIDRQCTRVRRELPVYLDSALPPARAAAVAAHLQRCPTCASRHAHERAYRARMAVLGSRSTAPAELRARIRALLAGGGAAWPGGPRRPR